MLPVRVIVAVAPLCDGKVTPATVSEPARVAPEVPSVDASLSTSPGCTANSAAGSSTVIAVVANPVLVMRPIAPPRER